jgi:hypothetical protein
MRSRYARLLANDESDVTLKLIQENEKSLTGHKHWVKPENVSHAASVAINHYLVLSLKWVRL